MSRSFAFGAAFVAFAFAAGCEKTPEPGEPKTDAAAPSSDTSAKDAAPSEPTAAASEIEVVPVTPEELRQRIAGDKGKAVFVDFWATWCVPCQKEYPHTVELSKKYAGDLVVYSVSMDENDEESVANVKEALSKFPSGNVIALRSSEGGQDTAYTGFEITGGALPHYKVFGRDGAIVATFGGDVDVTPGPEEIDAAVAKAIGE